MTTYSFHPALKADTNVPATLNFAEPFGPQVQKILESAGSGLGKATEVALSGQAVAAILMAAGLEMVGGLPTVTLYGFGQEIQRLGALDLADYRHNVVRSRRGEIPAGEAFAGYTVLDGAGRGLTPEQTAELSAMLNVTPEEIRVINVGMGQVDFSNPTVGVVEKLLTSSLTVADWSARRVLYLPAGAGLAATVQAVAIHGLSESWPRTIRLNKRGDAFHVEEIVDPQDMRVWGTKMVARWTSDQTVEVIDLFSSKIAGHGINASLEGSTLKVVFPDGQTFKLNVASAEKS